jgi:hypothetical protein
MATLAVTSSVTGTGFAVGPRGNSERQAQWISTLQRRLLDEQQLADAIAERLEQHELDEEELRLLDEWRKRRGFPPRRRRSP